MLIVMQREDLVEKFSEFLDEFYRNELVNAANEGKRSVQIDFSLLDKFDVELADEVLESPVECIPVAEEAVKQIDTGLTAAHINLRFYNLPETRDIRIRKIRSEHIGKMIVIEGLVKRASEIRPEVSEAVFECPECGNRMSVTQTERFMHGPARCDNEQCNNMKGFKIVAQKLFDARWLVVEEPFEIVTGERPSDLPIYLKEDLTDPRMQNRTDPGNRIKIVGILKELPRRVKGTRSRQMDIYLEANHVESIEAEWDELEITTEDEQKILELANDPEIYSKLVASIAPALFGLEEVKEAVAMQLFGGEQKILKDGSRIRGDIHILLIGDPSTAKSQLMKISSTIIPRGRYVSGKGVTQAGLTASVVRDEEFMGGWVLEAGALVLCNRSMLSIDEFEKVEKSDVVALHEAMEQQSISIAKANIVATLPARTAILAGGNPKLGRFDPYLPIREQIDVPETILARFDLKFALRDVPNVERDTKIAEHILRSRYFATEESEPTIPADTLKRYIAYARKNCHPRMTQEAADELKKFYLELRERSGEEAPIAITPRQYEALMRMAEASAKIKLSPTVSKDDAIRSINLMKASLRQFGLEISTGQIDIDRVEGAKATALQRNKIRTMRDVIDELEKTYGKDIPVDDILKNAKNQGLDNADDVLRKMLNEGILYQPRLGFVNKL